MTDSANAYPCPVCGAGADLRSGCPGCGRAPDPVAAEVIRLDTEIVALVPRVEQARQAYLTLDATLRQTRLRRNGLAERVRAAAYATRTAAAPAPRPVPPAQPVPTVGGTGLPATALPATALPATALPTGPAWTAPVGPAAPVRPEASTRTVQNVLFILGGLLVGTAAIVFTVYTWAAVGIAGRALILAGLTALALAAPLVARRRDLTATAETFATIGLLLVVLDGYAAWSVGLFGVDGLPPARYAAVVCAIAGVVAAGYRWLTGLTAPWYAGLLLAQPVVPLLAYDGGADVGGWALAFAGLAAINLGMTRGRGGDGPVDPFEVVRRSVAWVGFGLALLVSTLCGLLALVAMDGPTAVLAGGPLVVTALLPIAAALLIRHPGLGAVAGGAFVVALTTALVRAVVETSWPALFAGAVVVVGVAGLVAAGVRLLPEAVRIGPWVGGLVVASVSGVVASVLTLMVVVAVALRSQPAWRATLTPEVGPFDWQLPVAVPLTVLALLILLRRPDQRAEPVGVPPVPLSRPGPWRPIVLAGGVLTVLAAPAGLALPWWLVAAMDVAMAAALGLAAVRPHRSGPAASAMAGAALLLAGHGLLVGLARPVGAAAVLGALVLIGLAVARAALRPADPAPRHRRILGGGGLAVAVLCAPATVVLGLFAADVPPWWQARAALATAVLLCLGIVAVRRLVPHYLPYAATALSAVALPVGLSPTLARLDEPPGMYAAGALLVTAGMLVARRDRAASTDRPGDPRRGGSSGLAAVAPIVSGVILLGRAVAVVLPAVLAVLVGPYGWLGRIWSGPPAGVGLSPADWRPDPYVGVTLLLLTGTAVVVGWARPPARRVAALVAAPLAAATALVGLAAAGVRWPTVPVLTLAVGLAGLLAVALVRGARWRGLLSAPVVVPLGVAFGGAGLAGLLPTRAGTLAGLAAVVAAGLTAGAAGRTEASRVAGWLTAIAGSVALAVAAPLAADLPLRVAALVVLGVAALALAGGTALAGGLWSAGQPGAPRAEEPVEEVEPVEGAAPTAGPASPGVTVPVWSGGRAPVSSGGAVPVGGPEPVEGAVPGGRAEPVGPAVPVGGPVAAGRNRRAEAGVVEVASHLVAVVALALTIGEVRHAAAVCTLWGVALGLCALRPVESAVRRWGHVAAAGAAELVGTWLLLSASRVALVEAYTLPAAAIGLLAGGLALRTWPRLSSWLAYGPGLGAALLPSLVSVLVVGDQPWRRLLLGVGALLVVLAGARWRRQAPVVIGGGVLVVLALREVVDVWDRLPRWIFLAAGGFALIGLAMTYERRRRDLRRLRSAVGRMS